MVHPDRNENTSPDTKIRPFHIAIPQSAVVRESDLVYLDALDRLGHDYDGIISEWKHITREINADIVVSIMRHCLTPENLKLWLIWGNCLKISF